MGNPRTAWTRIQKTPKVQGMKPTCRSRKEACRGVKRRQGGLKLGVFYNRLLGHDCSAQRKRLALRAKTHAHRQPEGQRELYMRKERGREGEKEIVKQ